MSWLSTKFTLFGVLPWPEAIVLGLFLTIGLAGSLFWMLERSHRYRMQRRGFGATAVTPIGALTLEQVESAISQRIGQMQRETVAETFEASDGRWSSMVKHFEERCDALAESVQALAGSTAAVDNTVLERLGALQSSHKAIIDDYQRMSGLEARLDERLSRLKEGLLALASFPEKVESIRRDLVTAQCDLEKVQEAQRNERERRAGSLYAIGARERLARLQTQIEQDASALYDELKAGEVYDQAKWEEWESVNDRWLSRLNEWLETGTWYALAVKGRTLTIDDRKYGLDWSVLDSQFPNAEANRRFRKFCIIQQQWEEVLPSVANGLSAVAFTGLTDTEARSGRPAG